MLLHFAVGILLISYCSADYAKGLVYYPPYIDPFTDQNPCTQLYEWNLAEGSYQAPKQDPNKDCRGTFNGIPFIAPRVTANGESERIEDFTVDITNAEKAKFNMQFTCRDSSERVKSGLYFWVYMYRLSGVIKSYSYQTTMSWDTDGKLVFQPIEYRQANISCRYYDAVKGYTVAVRTWRLSFQKSQTSVSNSVEVYPCGAPSRPTLSSGKDVTVIVTSNRLEFSAFCPVVSCIESPQPTTAEFMPVTYSPPSPYCSSSPNDPASYPNCVVDPLSVKEISYSCTSGTRQGGSGSVRVLVQSGARYSNDEDFKPLYFKEEDRDSPLYCSVDPVTAPDVVPTWEFLSPSTYNGQYTQVVSSLYKQVNDPSGGKHKLIITTVKPEHEGSYRCIIPQSSRLVAGGKPIYGYYFVKVYGKPQCTAYDGTSSQQLTVNNGAVNIDLRLMSSSYITLQCSQAVVNQCPNGHDICEPVAMLYKDGQHCSSSNSTTNYCQGSQKIATSSNSPGFLKIDIVLNNNGGADANAIDAVKGTYVVQLVYPSPANLKLDVPFTINAAPPTSTSAGIGTNVNSADGGLWWIVLIVAGVILIVLILFVIGYCLRQSGQTYPVDKKERDAGHDPVKELKDNGFTDFAAQPTHGGSEPSISGSVKVPEDTDSLGEYGEIDPTKFNEDGSFIHQYGPGQHPNNAATASAITPASALGPRISGNSGVPLVGQQPGAAPQPPPPAIPGPPPHHRSGPAPPPRPDRSAASRQALPPHHPSGGTNV